MDEEENLDDAFGLRADARKRKETEPRTIVITTTMPRKDKRLVKAADARNLFEHDDSSSSSSSSDEPQQPPTKQRQPAAHKPPPKAKQPPASKTT